MRLPKLGIISQNPRMPERALKLERPLLLAGRPARQNPRMPERALKPGLRRVKIKRLLWSESPNARKGIETLAETATGHSAMRSSQNPRMPERALKPLAE